MNFTLTRDSKHIKNIENTSTIYHVIKLIFFASNRRKSLSTHYHAYIHHLDAYYYNFLERKIRQLSKIISLKHQNFTVMYAKYSIIKLLNNSFWKHDHMREKTHLK